MIARTQPLVVAWLATLIVTAAARYVPGIRLSDEQALYLAGGLFTVATAVVHRYVTPTARPRAADGAPLVPASPPTQTDAEPPRPSRIATERRPPPKSRGGYPSGDTPVDEMRPPVPPPPDPGKPSRGR